MNDYSYTYNYLNMQNLNNNNNEINNIINNEKKQNSLCRIYNYGFNCYMNSGLQIISRCDKLIEWLKISNFPKEECPFFNIIKFTLNEILNSNVFDPKNFIKYFASLNKDFPPNTQNCSQLFIKTVLSNINDEIINYLTKHKIDNNLIYNNYEPNINENDSYKNFLTSNRVFPQSLPYSYFSGIIKTESTGICNVCGEVKKYSFMDFFDQHMYLDTINDSQTDFKNVLKENLGYPIKVKSSCPICKNKLDFKDISKIIKLPEILVFTIERYIGETNRIPIIPNEIIELREYVENNIKDTTYELFAINIRFGYSNQFGHQICQIKKENNWYILNDMNTPVKGNINEYNRNTYGLFYKKIDNNKYFQSYSQYKSSNNYSFCEC